MEKEIDIDWIDWAEEIIDILLSVETIEQKDYHFENTYIVRDKIIDNLIILIIKSNNIEEIEYLISLCIILENL